MDAKSALDDQLKFSISSTFAAGKVEAPKQAPDAGVGASAAACVPEDESSSRSSDESEDEEVAGELASTLQLLRRQFKKFGDPSYDGEVGTADLH